MADDNSKQLLMRCEAGDEEAARQIFDSYVSRLIALARARLSPRLQRKVDPEDVVQSAYRSFFRRAGDGEYELKRNGDLWRLLAAITVHKVLKKAEYHQAAKRSINREQSVDLLANSSTMGVAPERLSRDPTPAEQLLVAEQLEETMRDLMPLHREMLKLRLQGQSVSEISEQVCRTEHSVRRVLRNVRERLESALLDATV
ncbi:MAG: sigma-70 family RNA polymerase sigma factor [Planctomycetales bacterium]|nr:sigma-70 family RNA polymerase sigma factor [Planctomycetales bacterium]